MDHYEYTTAGRVVRTSGGPVPHGMSAANAADYLQSSSTVSPPHLSNNMRGSQSFEKKVEEMRPSKRYAIHHRRHFPKSLSGTRVMRLLL